MRSRDKFRAEVTEALTSWRLGCIPPRRTHVETALVQAAISEILALRLRVAYIPVFETLERMQRQLDVAFEDRPARWAAPRRAPFQRYEPEPELPMFLR